MTRHKHAPRSRRRWPIRVLLVLAVAGTALVVLSENREPNLLENSLRERVDGLRKQFSGPRAGPADSLDRTERDGESTQAAGGRSQVPSRAGVPSSPATVPRAASGHLEIVPPVHQ